MSNQNLLRRLAALGPRLVVIGLLAGFCFLSASFSARAADDSLPPSAYRRSIVHDGGITYYVVGPRAPHLFMISRDVYGDEHRWHEIAEWNGLKAPYTLTIGQRLALKADSTLTDAQANRQLVVAWSNLQQWDTVERIVLSQKEDEAASVSVAVAAPVVAPVPVATATPIASPTPEPTPVASPSPSPTPAPTPAPEVVATPAPTPEEKGTEIVAAPLTEEVKEEKHESPWHFAVAPLVSLAKLHSEFQDTGIKNTLNTDVDYGVDADVGFHYNESDEIIFGAGIEHMDVRKSSGGEEIEGESQNLSHFSIGLRHEINHVSAVRVSFIEDEEAFSKPTDESAEIVPIYIPQISVGADWWLVRHARFGLSFNADFLALLPTKKDGFEFEMGYGGTVGFNFENEFKAGKLIYGISARYLNQDAIHVQTWQEMALAKIGWEF